MNRSQSTNRWAGRFAGVVLPAALLLMAGCEATVLGPEVRATNEAVFDEVWNSVDRHYAAFTIKDVDWSDVYRRYRPAVDTLSGDRQLYETLCGMLHELEDGHVTLRSPYDTCIFPGVSEAPRHFNPNLIRSDYVRDARRTPESGLTYGRISDDVGYLHISSFGTGDRAWSGEIDDVLEVLGPVASLVVDVRNNGGGSLRLAEDVAGRFADESRVYAYVEYRDGPSHANLSAPEPLELVPRGERQFVRPIALLTNRYCFSACEGFVLAMGELPHVVSVGDTTGGGFGNPLGRELPNGWTYRVPVWLMSTSDREYLEGIGIAPDVPSVITPTDVERARDTTLETALGHLARD